MEGTPEEKGGRKTQKLMSGPWLIKYSGRLGLPLRNGKEKDKGMAEVREPQNEFCGYAVAQQAQGGCEFTFNGILYQVGDVWELSYNSGQWNKFNKGPLPHQHPGGVGKFVFLGVAQKLLRGLITLWSRVEDGMGEREGMESSHVIDGVFVCLFEQQKGKFRGPFLLPFFVRLVIRPCHLWLSMLVGVCPCLFVVVHAFSCLSMFVRACLCLSVLVRACPCLSVLLLIRACLCLSMLFCACMLFLFFCMCLSVFICAYPCLSVLICAYLCLCVCVCSHPPHFLFMLGLQGMETITGNGMSAEDQF